jgi:hypothetical protein
MFVLDDLSILMKTGFSLPGMGGKKKRMRWR